MIGLKRGAVKLFKYNAKWKKSFEREANKISKAFGKTALDIQHVGSTAIHGILAKPIIDLAVIVSSLKTARKYIKPLKQIGYTLKKENRKDRLFFTKGAEKKRTHYLHIGAIRSGYIENMVIFRDYLRKHKDAAKEYSELKKELAEKYSDKREIYTRKKNKFVNNIIRQVKKI